MDADYIIKNLKKNKLAFEALLINAELEFREWRPERGKWNLHETVCHLLDEECFDFRARVKHVLETPDQLLPPINPQVWVKEKNYVAWNYQETLSAFLKERDDSVFYLHSLQKPDWKQFHLHPKLGAMSAEQFLVNWLAHDYLHIRQINRYQYLYLKEKSGVDLSYAGDW